MPDRSFKRTLARLASAAMLLVSATGLKTAKALGLAIPRSVLARTDEVIE